MNTKSFDPLTPENLKKNYDEIQKKNPNRQVVYFSPFPCGCAVNNFGHTRLCFEHSPKNSKLL